jgi:hypothetical protein
MATLASIKKDFSKKWNSKFSTTGKLRISVKAKNSKGTTINSASYASIIRMLSTINIPGDEILSIEFQSYDYLVFTKPEAVTKCNKLNQTITFENAQYHIRLIDTGFIQALITGLPHAAEELLEDLGNNLGEPIQILQHYIEGTHISTGKATIAFKTLKLKEYLSLSSLSAKGTTLNIKWSKHDVKFTHHKASSKEEGKNVIPDPPKNEVIIIPDSVLNEGQETPQDSNIATPLEEKESESHTPNTAQSCDPTTPLRAQSSAAPIPELNIVPGLENKLSPLNNLSISNPTIGYLNLTPSIGKEGRLISIHDERDFPPLRNSTKTPPITKKYMLSKVDKFLNQEAKQLKAAFSHSKQ